VTEPQSRSEPRAPWFAGRRGTVLLYRVNRRPLARPTLGGGEQPESFMDHVMEVLLFGHKVVTGHGERQHEWVLGNRFTVPGETALIGQVGWERDVEEQTSRYDQETQEWRDELEVTGQSAHAPFALDGTTRVLGVLKHPSFNEKTIANVFQMLLREGENSREWPSTEWSVEPILDERDFFAWLDSVQSVTSLTMVAKLPNPDGLEEFGPVWQEMQARKARLNSKKLVAADDNEGLQGLQEDASLRGNLAMGRQGFGYVLATGRQSNGHEKPFDQREKVAREVIEHLPQTWPEGSLVVLEVTRQSGSRVLRWRDRGRHSG
jgi:hypothetical protein